MQTKYYTNNSIFEQNWSMANGGVVSLLNGELYDYLSKYRNNTAYLGGAFNLEDESYIHLRETTVLGNNCTGNGAAIRIRLSHFYLESCHFFNNTAIPGGAAIFGEDGYADTYLGVFENHTAINGAVMEFHNVTTKLNSTLFRYNTASSYAGALRLENSEALVYNTTFYKNKGAKGGAVFVLNEVSTMIVTLSGHRRRSISSLPHEETASCFGDTSDAMP
jgi:hypothetical protein